MGPSGGKWIQLSPPGCNTTIALVTWLFDNLTSPAPKPTPSESNAPMSRCIMGVVGAVLRISFKSALVSLLPSVKVISSDLAIERIKFVSSDRSRSSRKHVWTMRNGRLPGVHPKIEQDRTKQTPPYRDSLVVPARRIHADYRRRLATALRRELFYDRWLFLAGQPSAGRCGPPSAAPDPRRPNASVCYQVNHSLGPNRLGDGVATATLSYEPPKEDKLRGRAHGERHRPEQSGTVDGHYSVQEK
jgi:hypothetical protein